MAGPTVFISYSHIDEAWKDLLLPHFQHLEKLGILEVWDDRQIRTGEDWYARIQELLKRASYANCLVSANFLDSSFCMDEEIPFFLQQRHKGGLEILPILVERCTWKAQPWLRRLQMLPRDGMNVKTHYRDDPAEVFAEVSDLVYEALQPGYTPPAPPPPTGQPPEKVDVDRLPETGELLFGRRDEQELLDRAWEDPARRILVFKAWGGVGKSALVRVWSEAMAEDNYRGARKVFAWSFYSQGTGERVTSADAFIASALAWFGDPDPKAGSPWDKGQRLARLVASQRTLLVLDGLEPLQSDLEFERGTIKDPGLKTLLLELADRSGDGFQRIVNRTTLANALHQAGKREASLAAFQ